jgi:hypothetical protein
MTANYAKPLHVGGLFIPDDGQLGNQRPNENGRSQLGQPEISHSHLLSLCVQRQAAAVRMFLCFFGLSILALEVGECHV